MLHFLGTDCEREKKDNPAPSQPKSHLCVHSHMHNLHEAVRSMASSGGGWGGEKNMKLMRTLVSMQASNCMRNKREYMQISGCGEFMHARKI